VSAPEPRLEVGEEQQLLEEEIEEAFGRQRYERRAGVDARPCYRNGRAA
jgi:hypothetical protein